MEVHGVHQPQEQGFHAVQQSEGTVMDYAEPIIKVEQLRRKAHDALQKREYGKAVDVADEIIVASRNIRAYCLDKLEKEQGDAEV